VPGQQQQKTADRIAEAVALLADGWTGPDAVAEGARRWGISPRQARRILASARQEVRSDMDIARPEYAALTLARLDRIARRAEAAEQFAAAVGALRLAAQIARLMSDQTMPNHRR
jgi:hypothetical protein